MSDSINMLRRECHFLDGVHNEFTYPLRRKVIVE